MKKTISVAWRKKYIRLIESSDVVVDSLSESQIDERLYGELIKEGYLDEVVLIGRNPPIKNRFLTVKGRLFLQEIKKKEFDESWLGRLRSGSLVFIGWSIAWTFGII